MRRLPLLILALTPARSPARGMRRRRRGRGCGDHQAATSTTGAAAQDRASTASRTTSLATRSSSRAPPPIQDGRGGVRRAREAVGYDHARCSGAPRRAEPLLADAKERWIEATRTTSSRGHRRRHALARRVRRHPRRRLERGGGSRERRAVRPQARRRPRARAAGQPLQPDRGHALGHASRAHRAGAKADLDGTESWSSARCSPTRMLLRRRGGASTATPRSSHAAAAGVAARPPRTRSRRSS